MVGTPHRSARITLLSIVTSVCLACASAPLSAPTTPQHDQHTTPSGSLPSV
jgi:hypothetical protein